MNDGIIYYVPAFAHDFTNVAENVYSSKRSGKLNDRNEMKS